MKDDEGMLFLKDAGCVILGLLWMACFGFAAMALVASLLALSIPGAFLSVLTLVWLYNNEPKFR